MVKKRVGIIGGGQLAWMLGPAAQNLGIDLVVQTPHPDDPAVAIASQVILASLTDAGATAQLAQACDVITFENEFVDLAALRSLEAQGVVFYPRLDTLALLLDKYEQRQYFRSLNLPVPAYTTLEAADLADWNFPLVVKARRHGYDGQGTFIVHSPEELEAVKQRLGDIPLLLEEFIAYTQELAVIGARNSEGEIVIYPVVETIQENQVCHRVLIPARISEAMATEIEGMTRYLLQELEAIGVFGLELFLTAKGEILINEIAPRTHNSGHYTIDACVTSQFALQLQAVVGLPLTPPTLTTSGAIMVNLLGYEYAHRDYQEKREKISAIPLTYLHWYGKQESRLGRKLGHLTILAAEGDSQDALLAKAQLVEEIWYNPC